MDFLKMLDFISMVLIVLGLIGMLFGVMILFSPALMVDLGVSAYILPRILMTWFGASKS